MNCSDEQLTEIVLRRKVDGLREELTASQRREHAMAAALLVIQGEHCQSFTSGLGSCYRNGRTDDATYGADRTCHSCLAHRVLSTTDPPAGETK